MALLVYLTCLWKNEDSLGLGMETVNLRKGA